MLNKQWTCQIDFMVNTKTTTNMELPSRLHSFQLINNQIERIIVLLITQTIAFKTMIECTLHVQFVGVTLRPTGTRYTVD